MTTRSGLSRVEPIRAALGLSKSRARHSGYADRIVVRLGDEVVAEHPRFFGRDQMMLDPWHYLPVLAKKPGALRSGAPFQDWDLPPALARPRRKPGSGDEADRRFVRVTDDPHLNANGGLVDLTLDDGRRIRLPALPIELDGTVPGVRHDLPQPGGDSRGMLGDFGFGEDEIEALIRDRAVAVAA